MPKAQKKVTKQSKTGKKQMPTYKIAGKIQKVEFKKHKTNLKVFSLTLTPDQNYFLKDDAHNFAVLVPGDEGSNQALAVKCKKEISFEFDTSLNISSLEAGKRMELELEENDSGKVTLVSDMDASIKTSGDSLQTGKVKQPEGTQSSQNSPWSQKFTLVSISILA